MFCGRQRELGYLERCYARSVAEFVVLWSRRGVGKSRLLYEWCREKPRLYFFAARLPSQALPHEFGQQLAVALRQPERTFADWDSASGRLWRGALAQYAALAADRDALMEKGLLWLKGNTAR